MRPLPIPIGWGSFGTTHAIHPENPVLPAFGHTREWRFRKYSVNPVQSLKSVHKIDEG